MTSTELLGIPIPASDNVDVYSGVARMSGKIWGALHTSESPSGTVALVIHPTSNFLGHYLLRPLAAQGIDAVGLTTRYIGNDSALTMENCVVDVGAAVRRLRELGYERVVLIGNSGGGGLAAKYQSQAENPTITATPAGDPPDLTRAGLPPADALIQLMAHPGRAQVLADWLDPAVVDESDPYRRDEELDLFKEDRHPPYPEDFVKRYRAAQLERNRRITAWVREQLERLAASDTEVDDLPFLVHGTVADPRFLDMTMDPSDREPGTMWGPPAMANFMPAGLAHFTSLRSWLSQWSVDESNCDAYRHLGHTSVPTFIGYGTADQVCFTSYAQNMFDAVPHDRKELFPVEGGLHYLTGQPDKVARMVTEIVRWLSVHELLSKKRR